MRSAPAIDPQARHAGPPEVRELLVLWQHPTTGEIVPIGRFAHHDGTYSFGYTRTAAAVEDFRPLPGLDLGTRYVNERIPAVFEQRVMEPDRPDFGRYVTTLGLNPAHATPWEQIVRSSGTRAGDTLQFMQLPTVTNGRARARFLTSGIRHVPDRTFSIGGRSVRASAEAHEQALMSLTPGSVVLVEPEADNPEDPGANLVTSNGTPLGWVPRALGTSVRELMSDGPLTLTVVRVQDRTTPPHLRLVLDLDAPAPEAFRFDREGRWELLPHRQ